MRRTVTFLLAVLLGQPAHAENRIQLVPYDPDQVVELPISLGYAAVVELGKDETVEDVVVGNSAGWQVTPDSSAQRVVVKPVAGAATTNMIVMTQARRYTFLLRPEGDNRDLFVVHFSYPADGLSAESTLVAAASYKLRGSKTLFPSAMQDDGKHTTITWNNQTVLPAVFAVEDGKETVVNGRMVGANYIVEGVAPTFVFRLGDAQAFATRKKVRVRR